jgi:hypothetical protein
VQKQRQLKKRSEYNSKFNKWDDEIMQAFQVTHARNPLEIIKALKPVTMRIGFQVKISQEIASEQAKFVKLECAYPLKMCPFYLLYEIKDESSIVFACSLGHSHEMGPIPLPPI